MGLEPTPVPVGVAGTVLDGEYAGRHVQIVGDQRSCGGYLVVLHGEPDNPVHVPFAGIAELGDFIATSGLNVRWPSGAEVAEQALDASRSWFGAVTAATLEEPFVGGMLNAVPVRLAGAEVADGLLILEFDRTWEVRLRSINTINPTADTLVLVAEESEIIWHDPTVASSRGVVRSIPFRWEAQ